MDTNLQNEKQKMVEELKRLEVMDKIMPLHNSQLQTEKQNQARMRSATFVKLIEGRTSSKTLNKLQEEQNEQSKNRFLALQKYFTPFNPNTNNGGQPDHLNSNERHSDNLLEFNKDDFEALQQIKQKQMIIAEQDLSMAKQQELQNSIFETNLMKKWDRVRKKLRMIGRMKRLYDEVKLYGTSCRVETSIKRHEVIQELEQMLNKQNEQIFKQPQHKNFVFLPDSLIKLYWSYIQIILLMYTSFITPIRIAFIDLTTPFWFNVELIIDILFMIDMLFNFNSAYFDDEGQLILDRKQIAMNYLKSWFILDLTATFPSDLIFDVNYQFSAYFKLTRLPRLYKLITLSRMMSAVQRAHKTDFLEAIQDLLSLDSATVRILKFFVTVIICVHIMGCFWYYIAKIYAFGPQTWVYELGLTEEDEYKLYLTSIYWAVTTICTVGFGDIHAFNNTERIICMFWMFFGVGFYSFTVGSLSTLIGALDTRESHLQSKITFMDEFCEETKLTLQMKYKIRKVLEYNSIINVFSQSEVDSFLSEIPTHLKFQIAQAMYAGLRNRLSYFKNKDSVFISTLIPKLQPMKIQSGEFIYSKNEYPNQVYFIVNGRVNMVIGVYSITFKTYVTGSYFGEIEIFDNSPRFHSARAEIECELLSIEQDVFKKILNTFPDYMAEIKTTSLEKLIREREAIEKLQDLTGLSQNSDFFRKKRVQSIYKSIRMKQPIQFIDTVNEDDQDMKSSRRNSSKKQSKKIIYLTTDENSQTFRQTGVEEAQRLLHDSLPRKQLDSPTKQQQKQQDSPLKVITLEIPKDKEQKQNDVNDKSRILFPMKQSILVPSSDQSNNERSFNSRKETKFIQNEQEKVYELKRNRSAQEISKPQISDFKEKDPDTPGSQKNLSAKPAPLGRQQSFFKQGKSIQEFQEKLKLGSLPRKSTFRRTVRKEVEITEEEQIHDEDDYLELQKQLEDLYKKLKNIQNQKRPIGERKILFTFTRPEPQKTQTQDDVSIDNFTIESQESDNDSNKESSLQL